MFVFRECVLHVYVHVHVHIQAGVDVLCILFLKLITLFCLYTFLALLMLFMKLYAQFGDIRSIHTCLVYTHVLIIHNIILDKFFAVLIV